MRIICQNYRLKEFTADVKKTQYVLQSKNVVCLERLISDTVESLVTQSFPLFSTMGLCSAVFILAAEGIQLFNTDQKRQHLFLKGIRI